MFRYVKSSTNVDVLPDELKNNKDLISQISDIFQQVQQDEVLIELCYEIYNKTKSIRDELGWSDVEIYPILSKYDEIVVSRAGDEYIATGRCEGTFPVLRGNTVEFISINSNLLDDILPRFDFRLNYSDDVFDNYKISQYIDHTCQGFEVILEHILESTKKVEKYLSR